MKLPQDKKERTKIFVLIGLGALVVAYLLLIGAVKPYLSGRAKRATTMEELQAKLEKADAKVKRMAQEARDNLAALSELEKLSFQGGVVLRDRLGNYLLSATEIAERIARDAGAELLSVKEGGLAQIPQAADATGVRAFVGYKATLELKCGSHGLLRFIRLLEEENPYLCVTGLRVAAQPGKPEAHAITLEVQWPAWTDAGAPARLAEQLRVLRETASEAPAASTAQGSKGS